MSGKHTWMVAGGAGLFLLITIAAWGFSRKASQLTVCEIQGEGEVSPYVGQSVKTAGLVSAHQLDLEPAGFFLYDPDCGSTEKGSAGIFVQEAADKDLVQAGDQVLLRGEVREVEGETRILTAPDQIQIVSLGNSLPPPVDLALEIKRSPGLFSYEIWEGQTILIGQGQVLGSYLEGGTLRYLPILDPPPETQLICTQSESVTLGLMGLDRSGEGKDIKPGIRFKDLTGFIRQNTGGYGLQVKSEKALEILPWTNAPDEVLEGGDLQLTGVRTPTVQPGTGTAAAAPPDSITPSPTNNPTPTWYPVDLLITELLPNPEGKEPQGEWLEIYNPKSYGQLLTGIKVGDETSPSGKEGALRFPDGYYIEAGEVLVIARQAAEFQRVYGFLPDFELEDSRGSVPDLLPYDSWGGSSVQFSNSGDEVILLDPWDQVVDIMAYGKGSGPGFVNPPDSPREGNSLERYPPERDRDKGDDWREKVDPSPGKLDRSPPTQAASPTPLTEASQVPALTPSNTMTAVTPTLPGSTVTEISSITPLTASLTASATPAPVTSQVYTPSNTPDFDLTATLTATCSPTPSPGTNPTTSVTVSATPPVSATPAPEASWTSCPEPSLTPSDTSLPQWTATYTPAPSVTPEPIPSISPTALQVVGLVLNEIHADPDLEAGDANGDGVISSDDDEFLELVNTGDHALDLSGWQVADLVRVRFIFPEGSSLEAGCALVIFGGGEPAGEFGGSEIYLAPSLGLNNAGDTVMILDESGVERIHYEYGSEGGEDQSLTLWPDLRGDLPMILHSEIPDAGGGLFSPGTMVDGVSFADCQ